MKKLVIYISCALLLLSGCASKKEKVMYENELGCKVYDPSNLKIYDKFNEGFTGVFDTVIQLTVYTDKASKYNEYYQATYDGFNHYNQLFDKYHTYEGVNNIKTINDNAGVAPVSVDPELMEMLVLSKEWYEKSNGAFDITLGPVLTIWHNYREEAAELAKLGLDGNVPTYDELQEAAQFVGWQYVELDEENLTVYINHPNASIDVGGVAKGFAAEKVAQQLECMGVNSGILNAGGNIRTIGRKPNGEAWSIGIQHPDKSLISSESIDSVRYKESMSSVTSGDYERYYMVDGVRYHHIISPFTLYPAEYYRSTSVNIKDSRLADILSTTMFILPYEEGEKVIHEAGGLGIWVSEEEKAFDAEHSEVIDGLYIVASKDLVSKMYYMK